MMIGQAYGFYGYGTKLLYNYYSVQTAPRSLYTTQNSQKSAQAQYRNDASNVTNSAKDVINAINKMTDPNTYGYYNTVSSNPDAVKVTASGGASAGTNYKIEVDQLAAAQKNEGASMNSNSLYTGAAGDQKFVIGINGADHEISVNIAAGETNNQVQRKIANAVNAKNIGVEAWVSNDGASNTSKLVFQSKDIGDKAANHFSVRDTSGSLVANSGIGNMTQDAQDAMYTVNNVNRTSKSNKIELGDGIKVELKEETAQPVTVSGQKDSGNAAEAAKEFVKAFNGFLSDSEDIFGGANWLNEYLGMYAKTYASTFAKAGIMKNLDGSFSIDEKKLNAAAEDGTLEKVFRQSGGVNYGLSFRISHLAKSVAQNPSSYIKPRSYYNDSYGGSNSFYGSGNYGNGAKYPSWIYNSYA